MPALVEEKPHPSSLSGGNFCKTLSCVFQDGLNLLALQAGKPLEKVVDARPGFEILEERPDRYPRAAKDPGAADLLRRTLNLPAL